MGKLVKDLITEELRGRYGELDSALWLELVGVDGNTTNAFRRDLRAKQLQLEVVRTSLFRRALSDSPMGRLAEALEGPAALLTGGESVIDAARTLGEWLPKIKGLKLRGALLEGEYLDEAAAAGLARMPNRRDLQARLASMILAPGGQVAAAILSGGSRIAGCLKAQIEKLEEDGGSAEAA